MKEIIRIEHLSQTFDNVEILKDINLNINEGEIVSIIGPSGSGKSTLLRSINLLNKPTSGKIYFKNNEIIKDVKNHNKYRQSIGMVFQQFNLFNNYNVLDNCTLGLRKINKMNKKEAEEIAMKNLMLVGLSSKIASSVSTLSGGQCQRVAIARCLSMNPEVILFDEPTSALDPMMVDEVLSVIRKLKDMNKTLIIVSHEMKFVEEISTKVIFMSDGDIVETGTPQEIFRHPQNEKTKIFLKRYLDN